MKILGEGKISVPLNNLLIIGRAPPNYLSFSGYATNLRVGYSTSLLKWFIILRLGVIYLTSLCKRFSRLSH